MAKTLMLLAAAVWIGAAGAAESINANTALRGVPLGTQLQPTYRPCAQAELPVPARPCFVERDEFAVSMGQLPLQLKGLKLIQGLGDSVGLQISAGKVHAIELMFMNSTFPLVRQAMLDRFGPPGQEMPATLLRGRLSVWSGAEVQLTIEEARDTSKGWGFVTLRVNGPTAEDAAVSAEALRRIKAGL